MNSCYLGLGSNLGSPPRIMRIAIKALRNLPKSCVIRKSSIYQTQPWGVSAQPDYSNAVVEIHTRLTPFQLLSACQALEKKFHRVRKKHWGPRTLDIDILLYDLRSIQTPKLKIPHPYMFERDFVLLPLKEIAPHIGLQAEIAAIR